MVNVLIKNVDENAYKLAKMLAIKEEKTIGQVISEAVQEFVKRKKQVKRGFSALPTFDFGSGNENLSIEIDDVLYGPRNEE